MPFILFTVSYPCSVYYMYTTLHMYRTQSSSHAKFGARRLDIKTASLLAGIAHYTMIAPI